MPDCTTIFICSICYGMPVCFIVSDMVQDESGDETTQLEQLAIPALLVLSPHSLQKAEKKGLVKKCLRGDLVYWGPGVLTQKHKVPFPAPS